ncbi:MAG TPA: hypothetical protein VMM27_16925, partial [Casimicrobiaceae bacterium]|nr:hypothetical protein [Casimicrobiaceae bacterium]
MPSALRSCVRCALAAGAASLLVCGCATLSSWLPSWVTSPSWPWSKEGPKLGPLPDFEAKTATQVNWQ